MQSKTLFPSIIMLLICCIASYSQDSVYEYDMKFNLTICTTNRNAPAELTIINGSGNTFTGILFVDGEQRDVFGWYTEKKSEGGGFIYDTKGIVFYVRLKADFQHQQLFRGILNYDESYLSGTFFYWGNEFIFYGDRSM